jgi:selenocysteine-specific elongation factor
LVSLPSSASSATAACFSTRGRWPTARSTRSLARSRRHADEAPSRDRVAVTVGTAGHVDHGKTTLVRALTGRDTDRLPEERARGISIDLGYAPLALPGGSSLSLVDVPGHERFVRTMVAGATGIDLFLLVIDAAEGARPQTHEHLAILRLLGVERGVVAVTKADAVDSETLELALVEARELVPEAPVVAVSGVTGAGLDELRAALETVASSVEQRRADFPARLYVDRVFTLRGIGTVVTGTLWSGAISEGDQLRVEPSGREVRIRSVQVHDTPVVRAEAGQRVAVSLPGVERADVRRGDALVAPDAVPRSYRLEVTLSELTPIADGARLSVHHGTSRIPARVVRVGEDHAQLRLASPVVAARGDRLVLRAESTVGGAVVLDPAPPRRVDPERDRLLGEGDPASIVRALVHEPVPVEAVAARALLAGAELEEGLDAVRVVDGWAFSDTWLEDTAARVATQLRKRAERSPLDPGMPLAELLPNEPWATSVLGLLPVERRGPKAYLPGVAAGLGERSDAARELAAALDRAGLVATKVDDPELARFLEADGSVVRLGDGYAVAAGAYEVARDLVATEAATAGEITLARFRDLAGVGRRDAQLLLERMDVDGFTRRVGDRRVLRRVRG